MLLAVITPTLSAQQPDPLGGLVAAALRANLGLAAERVAEHRAAADVRDARGLFFPTLGLASRYSRLGGVPNIGDFVNPAYTALNGLLGQSRFPTNLDITLGYEQRVGAGRLKHSLFAKGLLSSDAQTPEYLRGGVNALDTPVPQRGGSKVVAAGGAGGAFLHRHAQMREPDLLATGSGAARSCWSTGGARAWTS